MHRSHSFLPRTPGPSGVTAESDSHSERGPARLPSNMIQRAIHQLLDGHDLTRAEAREVMGEIMGGEATPAQISGFLVALRAKGETAEEIAGSAEAMRELVRSVQPSRDDVVDVVGTGGDGARTFNISTTAAIVAASANAAVAKHGNR